MPGSNRYPRFPYCYVAKHFVPAAKIHFHSGISVYKKGIRKNIPCDIFPFQHASVFFLNRKIKLRFRIHNVFRLKANFSPCIFSIHRQKHFLRRNREINCMKPFFITVHNQWRDFMSIISIYIRLLIPTGYRTIHFCMAHSRYQSPLLYHGRPQGN